MPCILSGVITALAVTNGSDGWQTAGGDGPAIGSATLTITSVSTMTSDADGKVYVAHGTITATLVADPSTTATGTVTLTANFQEPGMHRMRRPFGFAMAMVSIAAGCSKRSATAPAAAGTSKAGITASAGGNACERKLVVSADMAGIVTGPITGIDSIPGDPASCVFNTAGYASVTVTLRAGVGTATVDSWTNGKMPVPAVRLPGVGDKAVWVDGLHEVIAEKNGTLCDIQVMGSVGDYVGSAADQQRAIGALCNRIFAALT